MTDLYTTREGYPPDYDDLPSDEQEISIQETVDTGAFGVSKRLIGYEPSREQEAEALLIERNAITEAARQIAMVLANSGKQVSRVQSVASQCIMRTVLVPAGVVAEKLVSENFERSKLKIWVPAGATISIATTQINGTFTVASGIIPSNCIVLVGSISAPTIYEVVTTDQLYALADTNVTTATPVCILEEFNS
jgi:hypothetical protein